MTSVSSLNSQAVMTGYWAYRGASWLSRILPLSLAYGLGLRLADLFYVADRSGRRDLIRNLRHIHQAQGQTLDAAPLRRAARRTYRHFGKYLVDFFRFGTVDSEWAAERITVEHEQHLKDAVAAGRGVILATAHFGNWELGGAVLASRGQRIHAVVLPYRSAKLERLFDHYRARRGIHTIPVGGAVRELIHHLNEKQMVALLADRDFSGQQHEAQFFGRSASMPRGPAWLAVQTGAPILPAFMVRQEDDSFVLRFHPPLWPQELETEEGIRDRLCRILEEEIKGQPHQWFIFEDFWAPTTAVRGHRHE